VPYRFLDGPCPVCQYLAGTRPWVPIRVGPASAAYVAPRQRTPGTVLVVPVRHVVTLTGLTTAEAEDLWRLVRDVMHAAQRVFDPESFHISQYTGIVTEETLAHLHWRVEPRYPEESPHAPIDELPHLTLTERSRVAERIRAHWPPPG
jgi:diadenosine tetraphosphate (Ap4A) HIT family hydrolase